MLAETGLFAVDVVTAPAARGELAGFHPGFAEHGAVVLNYDAPDDRWPAELKREFERYVDEGGGLVIVHAADNAFPAWKAFNEMIGVGGWRDRNESAGPRWFVKDGALASDSTPGSGGKPRHATAVPPVAPRSESPDHEGPSRPSGCTRATSCTRRCADPDGT